MKKIRIGNDFVLSWAIERGGVPENLENVSDKHLYMIVFGTKTEIHNYTVSGNNIIVEFTPELLNKIGIYTLIFYYVLPDTSLSDNDRKCTVDIDAFQIVPKTAMADDSSEFSVTSDMAIAFQGKSAYSIWRETHEGTEEDYLAWLQQPATDAAEIAEEAAKLANQKAIDANDAAQAANEAAQNANSQAALANEKAILANAAAQAANNAAALANEKAGNADSATIAANEAAALANTKAEEARNAASLANEKAELAETKAGEAETAAELANEARLDIEGDLTIINDNISQLSNEVIDDEEVIATDLNELAARLSALEAAFRNMIISKMQVDSIDVLKDLNYQGRPLFIVSNVAPNIVPDGVPQFWINTSNGDFYSAQNVNSVASWKLK